MSRRGNSSRVNCELCGQNIGRAGFAYVSHMRAHVRRGEATEHISGTVLEWGNQYVFKPTGKAATATHKYKRSCDCAACMKTFRERLEKKYNTTQ